MLREELAEKLGLDDDSAMLAPIEEHLLALATDPELPAFSVGACALRMEEAGPALRAVLHRAADGDDLSAEDAMLLIRGLHLLGGARDPQACQPLWRLLRFEGDGIYDLLGDASSETLSRIAVGVFDGDADALFSVIGDNSVEPFVRSSLFDAAAFLTWEGRIELLRMRAFLERFHTEKLAEDNDFGWFGWLTAIALLGLRDLAPLVLAAWDEGRIPEGLLDPDEFEKDLAAAEQAPEDARRFEQANVGYIEDVLVSLERFQRAAGLFDSLIEDPDELDENDYPTEPITNPLRHVGRNDPCPCGSGKKYKKCCLAA